MEFPTREVVFAIQTIITLAIVLASLWGDWKIDREELALLKSITQVVKSNFTDVREW